jgi:hypothetical protein
MASIDFLEEILDTVEKIPAKEEPALPAKEEPALPVKSGVGIDLVALGKLDIPSATPSKKNWSRGATVNSSSKNATSPSEASTQIPFSPGAEMSVMSVSPTNLDAVFDDEAQELPGTVDALQALAEKYAQIKKTLRGDELANALQAAAEGIATALGKDAPQVSADSETRAADLEKFLQEIVRPFVPVVDFEETSIGSILHLRRGVQNCAGLCRFHVKGKCFDGILCRFCHMSRDEHAARTKNESPTRDRSYQDRRWDSRFTPTPPKNAPLAHPLLCLPMPAPMPMVLPQIAPPLRSHKPATKEQEGLCELLSSIKVQTPEEVQAQQMQQMQMQHHYQQMQQMQQMQHFHYLQQMSHMYSPAASEWAGSPMEQYWAEQNPVPVVPHVATIHARRAGRSRRTP